MNGYSADSGNNKQNSHKIEIVLKQIFPDINIILERVNYGGCISVFIAEIKNERVLENNWNEISNSIAAYYQTNLTNEFEKWNMYIIYKCNENISNNLTYKIENDKFSSRKIVHIIDNNQDKKLLDNIIVTNYITNKDLEINDNITQLQREYESESKLWSFISNGKIRTVKNSLKEVESVLEQIENFLQNED